MKSRWVPAVFFTFAGSGCSARPNPVFLLTAEPTPWQKIYYIVRFADAAAMK
jgi:hypothetical protein